MHCRKSTKSGVREKCEIQRRWHREARLREPKMTEPVSGELFKGPPASSRWRILPGRRTLIVPRIARGIACFDPRCRLGELFRNLAQKLRRALFRFRRGFLLHKTLHAREFFVNALAK